MNHYYRKKRNWYVLGPLFFIAFIAIAFLAGWIVMWLWNTILPPVLGLNTVTYWQAVGLLILSRILFGGFAKGAYRRRGSSRWREKWMNMSEEEKYKFREEWKRRESGESPDQPAGA